MNTQDRFIETAQRLGRIDRADAQRLYVIYKTFGVLKVNVHTGAYHVVHGSYLDKETIAEVLANN